MHPRRSAQYVLLCDLCETASLHSHCERCNIGLCKACVVEHLSDSSKRHKIVSFSQTLSQRKSTQNYPKCPKHPKKHCELYCEKCDIPVCITCVSSGQHKGHNVSDIQEKITAKTQSLQRDLEELETRIIPRYEEMAYDVESEKVQLNTKYGKLDMAVDQQGKILQQKVTAIVNHRKSGIKEMRNKHLDVLNKNADATTQKITELKKIIAVLKSILKSNDLFLTSTYKSRNSEFRTLPPMIRVTPPDFFPGEINKDQLNKMMGSLSSLFINKDNGDSKKSPEAALQLGLPQLTATIGTAYGKLISVSCFSEEEVWTRGNNSIMKLLNLRGELVTSVQTESGCEPRGIAVTNDGDLVYTDSLNRTINLVKNKKIRTVVKLKGWIPLNACSTSSDDLLFTMISDDFKESKVVRYFGSTKTQTIQFDNQGRPLYLSGRFIISDKYISENRNLDICVADHAARAIVVVNQSGNLRFRYTRNSFIPHGIATDSQSHILTADCENHRIHILDQDGQFLLDIRNCGLHYPCGLCVDIRDNLFVAERVTARVKKIQYLSTQC